MRRSANWRAKAVYGLFLLFLFMAVGTRPRMLAQVTHTVEISQMKFSPGSLSVKKGDKVVFVNKDVVTHNVTETSKNAWQSPALASGQSWTLVASKSVAYYCSFHPVMKGSLTVHE
ncbi:hypothetical protein GU926_08860 [Nibribacter ruber]|uniref:Blue (type 1) copper domain-containing protein n=1 Tax=Nibribacter ruber TaxID=2698458 RepID=A0A6P1NZY1_9BACT|nr:cupredoxin family copper-binding protein [Nibribacter ruber]QHL87541.1 hypothetical protein GU926_08860 [Nibribacter ruber]